jgi:hypothetical protein
LLKGVGNQRRYSGFIFSLVCGCAQVSPYYVDGLAEEQKVVS